VRTCPTGIDIRDGLQMECVNCTQCIDACDYIMDSIGKPRGLIRFTSLNALEDKDTKVVRPRTIAYSLLLAVLITGFGWMLTGRGAVEIDVGRAGGAAFQMIQDDDVANRLRFRIQNRSGSPHSYTLEALAPADTELKVVGPPSLQVGPGEMKRVEVWVVVPRSVFTDGATDGRFAVKQDGETIKEISFKLLGPQS
jgi:polyferredoxin